jgi:hypothetical protein
MIGRAATRIDLKIDDDLKELDEDHMVKLRDSKKEKPDNQSHMFINGMGPQIGQFGDNIQT